MINKVTNKKGITLIALVITIIVLLILAGVSISMISSQDGILNQATRAKETQKNATELERINLAVQSALIDGEGTVDLAKAGGLEKALQEEFKNDSEKPTYEEGKITLSNGEIYSVTTSGSIKKAVTFNKQKTVDLAVGDEITASNGENFYVIGFSADNTKVNLLAKYNLKKESEKITLKQDETEANNSCAFSSTNYWSNETNYPLDLNNYSIPKGETSIVTIAKEYGESLGATGRLLSYEEANALKTENSTILCGEYDGKSLDYWLGNANSNVLVWIVMGMGHRFVYWLFC